MLQKDETNGSSRFRELSGDHFLLHRIVGESPYGINITQNRKFIFVNKAFCDMMMYTAEELIGMPGFDVVAPPQKDRMFAMHTMRMAGLVINQFDRTTLIRKDGSYLDVEIRVCPFEFEGLPATLVFVTDLTEKNLPQIIKSESNDRYYHLFQSLLDALFLICEDKFMLVNEPMVNLLGYTVAEMVGKTFHSFIAPENFNNYIERYAQYKKGAVKSMSYETTLLHRDGTTRIPVIISSNLTEIDGKKALVGTVKDISDRVKAEKEIRDSHNRLEELNHHLEEIVEKRTLELTEVNTQLLRLQKENLQSQFDVLKQQVNPHFLFNSLNVLTSLIRLEPELAEKFTEHLSKVYRYVLENKDNELVKLSTELEFLHAYIFLLNIRFMDKIKVNINISEDNGSCMVIPLALQLLIENAIKHNAMSKKSPLVIDIYIDKNFYLNVVNNLQERGAKMVSTGVGLKNIMNRYRLLNNLSPEFEKTSRQFIARIPLICDHVAND
jgi:PAS domain S-box-containing protein